MLEVLERLDHLAAKKAIGAPDIRLAGALREGLWLLLRKHHRLPCQVGDRIDEDDRLRTQELFKPAAGVDRTDMVEVLLAIPAIGIDRRIRSSDQHHEVAEVGETPDRDTGAWPVLDRLHAGLEVKADGLSRVQGLQQRGFA